ncbi:MAG: hypothetical protein KIT58_13925, partial [Planctomycetota bacterium]|nr:hypothetical protein [Planctomycetota bacterium]
ELARQVPNAERLEVYGPADAPLALVRGRRRRRLRSERRPAARARPGVAPDDDEQRGRERGGGQA